MKIQVSTIVGPILLLSLAARSTLAEDTAATEDVATIPSNLDPTCDMKHTQLDRGLTTAVEPEKIFEVGGEDKVDEEDMDDEDDEEYDEEYDEDDEDETDEVEDQDVDEYEENDENKPYADNEDIKLNGIDAVSQEAEERASADFSAQTEGADTPTDQGTLSSLATAEPGGACIDSFVNFALRFQDHCTIFCLKIFTHIFAKPNVLGVLDCFSCSNFMFQGFVALGQDCFGLFTSDPMTPEDIRRAREAAKATPVRAPAPTGDVKTKSGESVVAHVDDGSQLRGPEPLNLDSVIDSLQNVDMDQVHEWLEIGKGIVSVINSGAKSNTAQEEQSQEQPQEQPPQNGEVFVETQTGEQGQVRAQKKQKQESSKVDKDEFNEYIVKAAKFANVSEL